MTAARAIVLGALLLAACGRSSLLGSAGVDVPPACDGPGCQPIIDMAGCVGAACLPPPDMACVGVNCPPPPVDMACVGINCPPPPPDMACVGPNCPPPIIDGGFDAGGDGPPTCNQLPENCTNNKDDNCNGLVDCKDPGCSTDPHCFKPGQEICNNGIDDDKNGFIDCKDAACVNFPGCKVHMCDPNNVDCTDPLCNNVPQCQNLACKPTVDFGTLPQYDGKSERMVSSVGTMDVALTPCAPGGGGMVVTQFTLSTDATVVTLSFQQAPGGDHVFGLFRAGVNQTCVANPLGCYDPKSAATGTHSYTLDKGQYYLIVQAFTKQHQGALDITLTTTSSKKKEICNNGVDDDGNGLIDCADPVCVNDAACKNKVCKPDTNVGTLVVADPAKSANFTTVGGQNRYSLDCGGKGNDYAIQFTLAQSAGVLMDFRERNFSDHTVELFKLPPAGQSCDTSPVANSCWLPNVDPNQPVNGNQVDWGELGAGDYLFIVKAVKAGQEGPVDITLRSYLPQKIEICHNGIDDDNNGLTDCADPACVNDAGCGPPVCMPSVDFGTLHHGDSQTANLNLVGGIPALTATCAKGGGRSRVIQFTLDQVSGLGVNCDDKRGVQDYVVDLFYVAGPRDACDKTELSCADPGIIPFGCNFEWPNIQPGTYYLIAQAFQAGLERPISITLSSIQDRALEVCNNGIDDDGDGFIDCADKKCATSPYCAPKACKADQTIDPMPLNGMAVARNLDTTNKQVTAQPPCEVKPGGGNGVVFLNMPAKANLNVAFLQGFGSTNHVMAIYPDLGNGLICEAAKSIACQATNGAKMGTLSFPNLPGGNYWFVVAADKPGDEGPIFLNFTAMP